jgi:glycosyltransferase involved in cell wall biosynthesis
VCVLAHNEEKYISKTIEALLFGLKKNIPIYIYANGCSDHTIDISYKLKNKNSNIHPREIVTASKTNAWNTAFWEHKNVDYIVFSDGDIVPSKGAIEILINDLEQKPDVIISTSRLLPRVKDISFEKIFVGFLQLPFKHEFLSGGLYAIRRKDLLKLFEESGLNGLPLGIVGEDCFLELLMRPGQLHVSRCKNFYEPPSFKDYLRYLARIEWQNKQLRLFLGHHKNDSISFFKKVYRKLSGNHFIYILIAFPAVFLRTLFKKIFSSKIREIFYELGPVRENGNLILSQLTRSNSCK